MHLSTHNIIMNQHIILISKDWRNDAENSVLHHRNILHFKLDSNKKQVFDILIVFH